MGVDAEKILVCLWRFLHFFMNASHRCLEKHPFVSSILLLSFIVYIFFNVVVYCFPFLVFTAILVKFFWSSGHPTIVQDAKESEKRNGRISNTNSVSVKEDHVVHRNIENPSFQTQKSRRRNFKDKNRPLDAQAAGKEEKDMFPSATANDNLIGNSASIDRDQKVDDGEKKSSLEHGEKSASNALAADNVQVDTKLPATYSELEVEEVDDDDEEETQEDGNHAMEWTADDEKNLMDLGLSEIERNKRLESLIAKRRARKIFKLQVEKALSSMHGGGLGHVAPILIAKNDHLNAPNNSNETEGLHIPGSAPSVLLPTQNPFDLPYDPHEEKPNLMADSFQQEFTEAHQKEMLFCRHESFSLGPSFPLEYKQDRNDFKFNSFIGTDRRALDGLGYSRFRMQPDKENHDQLIEHFMSKPYHSNPHINNTPDVIEKGSNFPTQLIDKAASKDEENAEHRTDMVDIKDKAMTKSANPTEPMFARSEAHIEPQVIEDGNDESPSPSSSPTSSSSSSSSSEITPNIFNPTRAGIPKPTLGYAAHNSLGLSVPRSITSRDPFYDSSPTANNKSKMEERLIYAMRPCHTATYSIASDMQVEVSDCGSPPAGNENNSPTDTDSLTNFGETEKCLSDDHKTFDDNRKGMEQVRDIKNSPPSDALLSETSESSMQQTDKLEPHLADEVLLSEKTEESLNHPGESTEEKSNIIYDERASVIDTVYVKEDRKEYGDIESEARVLTQEEILGEQPKPAEETKLEDMGNSESFADHQLMDNENLDLIGDSENPQTLIQQDNLRELPKPTEETTLESNKHVEVSSDNPADHQTMESVLSNEDNENSNTIEDSKKPPMLDQQEIARELPKPVEEVRLESDLHNEKISQIPDKDQSKETVEPDEGTMNLKISQIPDKDQSKETVEPDESTMNLKLIQGDGEELIEQEDGIKDMSKTIEAEAQVLIKQENVEDLPRPSKGTELQSNIDNDFKSENPAHHQPMESVQPKEDNENSRLIRDSEKLAEQEGGLTGTSSPIAAKENLLSSEDSKDEQNFVESEDLHANQSSDDPISSVVEQVPPVDVVPVNSSPSSSPTSVLTKHIAVGEMSSASLNEMVQIDVPQSDTEAMVRSSSSEELSLDNEPSNPPENFTDEFNIIGSTSKPLIDDKVGTEEPESDNKATDGDLATLLNPEAVAELSKEDLETHKTPIEDASGILEDFQTETISKISDDKEKLKSDEESGSQPDDAKVNLEAMKDGGLGGNGNTVE
ncbi:uncharacterized protein LOC112490616 [Ziziphus jujuba]|uniref:Uncharacterized protein LOC112490616 n=1 Tax=Ziziphus jujuba TaxID=326968 RepID=A0ABM3I9C3_ZIZJJ|nr:uncharacterized protein LOC112490616 [Ziziphus jujuba]